MVFLQEVRIREMEGLARELAEKKEEQLQLYGYIDVKQKKIEEHGLSPSPTQSPMSKHKRSLDFGSGEDHI